jgi:hypothetical protein
MWSTANLRYCTVLTVQVVRCCTGNGKGRNWWEEEEEDEEEEDEDEEGSRGMQNASWETPQPKMILMQQTRECVVVSVPGEKGE